MARKPSVLQDRTAMTAQRSDELREEDRVRMSCPFAGMTRIRFKGSPQLRSLSSVGTPRNEA